MSDECNLEDENIKLVSAFRSTIAAFLVILLTFQIFELEDPSAGSTSRLLSVH